MDQTIGNRIAQQQMMSTRCRMSRHVNHDRDAGVFSSRMTIATSAHTCVPHQLSLVSPLQSDTMTLSQLGFLPANETVTVHKVQCTVLCAHLHVYDEANRAAEGSSDLRAATQKLTA